MQEPYPRSQSVLQTRSSSFQTTASRILHKFSNFKVRIGNNSRNNKSIDDNDKNPYRETRSMDLDMHVTKPYMSQPMLSIPNMLHENDNDSSGSSPRSMHMPSRRPVDGLPQTSFDVARIKHRYQAQLENEPEVPSSRKRPTTSDSTATITPQSTHPPPPLPPITMTSTTNVPSLSKLLYLNLTQLRLRGLLQLRIPQPFPLADLLYRDSPSLSQAVGSASSCPKTRVPLPVYPLPSSSDNQHCLFSIYPR
ncbi:hypothetical protein BT96DRAFT_155432 [Gymnopus androsaceus JB14]|uniref:Uncharacterized protein n=1 Tax=Gymnopus androsaceus JB14 TaxID=1447944 RepID=A0A6A4HAJ8_9AGAR|nr:hypothetical protein BT96DRAFT_155432 [Gymnopus androsaceus JB14]